jgi:hypothetical protein
MDKRVEWRANREGEQILNEGSDEFQLKKRKPIESSYMLQLQAR